MGIREEFGIFIRAENKSGSNRATSYIRAIELLDSILSRKAPHELGGKSIWAITAASQIQRLYHLVLEHQKLGKNGFFADEEPISYWRDGFCSAALRSYREFLVTHLYEQKMWAVYEGSISRPEELSVKLAEQEVDGVEALIEDQVADMKSREGRDAVCEVKTRIGQGFFRKMILRQYNNQCCVTGLTVPEVLRASHIIGWAEDEDNRMNPSNGMCLSATYDAAFDRNLISFDDDYRMILSLMLKEYYTNTAFKEYFLSKEGTRISCPESFLPDSELLQKHRQKLLK
jgi:putative restriction endonuclease